MGNVVPPRQQHTARYLKFQQDATTSGSSIEEATQEFDKVITVAPTENVEILWGDLSSLINTSSTSSGTTWGASPDEYARAYLIGDKLAKLCNSSLQTLPGQAAPTAMKVQVNAQDWDRSIFTPPTTYSLPTDPFNQNEIDAQNEQPELFMLWACRAHINPTNLAWAGLALDVAAVALPALLYTVKARSHVERPYQVNTQVVTRIQPKPTHSSWVGGHAYLAGALGVLLATAFGVKLPHNEKAALEKRLTKAARRIAVNREVAGLHWTQDSIDGLDLGVFVMSEMLKASKAGPSGPGELNDLQTILSNI